MARAVEAAAEKAVQAALAVNTDKSEVRVWTYMNKWF